MTFWMAILLSTRKPAYTHRQFTLIFGVDWMFHANTKFSENKEDKQKNRFIYSNFFLTNSQHEMYYE